MYRSIYYDSGKEKIHLWGDGEHGDAGYSVHNYEPYAYIIDPKGEYTTIDGHKCKKISSWSNEAVKLGLVYEHNVSPVTRFLIDKYIDSDEVSTQTKILYLDIEVAKEERYSSAEDADNTITAITYFATGDERYTCLLLDTQRKPGKYTTDIKIDTDKGPTTIAADIITFQTEHQLLRQFVMNYQKIGHNIITGWNVEFFDMPYLYNRIVKVINYEMANLLSPDAKIVKRKYTTIGQLITIAGVTVLDYLNLYKKFTYTEQANYRLNTIAQFELKRGKVEYEGDLDNLYKTDIVKFAEYNIVDVELIVAMDKKLELIMTALGLCHKGHCAHSDIQFTSMYLDGAALIYCRRNNLVASANRAQTSDKAEGAFVKQPTPGLYKWVYDLDLVSLYPMTIITLNISPETKFAKVVNWDEGEFSKGTDRDYEIIYIQDKSTAGELSSVFDTTKKSLKTIIQGSSGLKSFMDDNNLCVSSNGILYSMDRVGIIPAILNMWFDDRKTFKDLRKKAERDNDIELAAYYDRKQLITKILLNSFYGVLLLPTFRFYDKENGEAVTLTGQSVIRHATIAADYFYNKELDEYNCEYDIEFEDGSVKTYHGFDKIGDKYVFQLLS